jgi:putative glycosyltransferase (TIGR04348 family)
MKICLVTPAPAGSRKGNRITALRWARILRTLGHRVGIHEAYTGQRGDLLIALHARKSASSVQRFHHDHPVRPILLALTGTDLYEDIHTSVEAQQALEIATRLIVLQPLAVEELPVHLRPKVRVIYQSVPPINIQPKQRSSFDVCVMGHLRPVKDPFRTALAARLLPSDSSIRVLHLGAALSEEMAEQARREESRNPRYHWLGEQPRGKALRQLGRCRLLSLTSRLEGGANVISEAVTVGVPVVSSRIAGSIGLLGADYPGYFPVGDTQALADLLRRAETDGTFLEELRHRCEALRRLFEPAEESRRWQALLEEVGPAQD